LKEKIANKIVSRQFLSKNILLSENSKKNGFGGSVEAYRVSNDEVTLHKA